MERIHKIEVFSRVAWCHVIPVLVGREKLETDTIAVQDANTMICISEVAVPLIPLCTRRVVANCGWICTLAFALKCTAPRVVTWICAQRNAFEGCLGSRTLEGLVAHAIGSGSVASFTALVDAFSQHQHFPVRESLSRTCAAGEMRMAQECVDRLALSEDILSAALVAAAEADQPRIVRWLLETVIPGGMRLELVHLHMACVKAARRNSLGVVDALLGMDLQFARAEVAQLVAECFAKDAVEMTRLLRARLLADAPSNADMDDATCVDLEAAFAAGSVEAVTWTAKFFGAFLRDEGKEGIRDYLRMACVRSGVDEAYYAFVHNIDCCTVGADAWDRARAVLCADEMDVLDRSTFRRTWDTYWDENAVTPKAPTPTAHSVPLDSSDDEEYYSTSSDSSSADSPSPKRRAARPARAAPIDVKSKPSALEEYLRTVANDVRTAVAIGHLVAAEELLRRTPRARRVFIDMMLYETPEWVCTNEWPDAIQWVVEQIQPAEAVQLMRERGAVAMINAAKTNNAALVEYLVETHGTNLAEPAIKDSTRLVLYDALCLVDPDVPAAFIDATLGVLAVIVACAHGSTTVIKLLVDHYSCGVGEFALRVALRGTEYRIALWLCLRFPKLFRAVARVVTLLPIERKWLDLAMVVFCRDGADTDVVPPVVWTRSHTTTFSQLQLAQHTWKATSQLPFVTEQPPPPTDERSCACDWLFAQ